jgi:antitoxin (DNA-binding transcriptional repressor) of toxin-antitoxin stability system
VVTVSGEPVALLGPLHSASAQVSITELIAKTALIAPRRKDDFVLSAPVAVHSGARIDQLLREVRG